MKASKENIENILSKLSEGYSVDLIDANETGKYRSIFISPYEENDPEEYDAEYEGLIYWGQGSYGGWEDMAGIREALETMPDNCWIK